MHIIFNVSFFAIMVFLLFSFGHLREQDCGENKHAASDFTHGKRFAEEHPPGEHGKDGFQAQQYGGKDYVNIFLSGNLQCIGNAAAHNSCMCQRQPGRGDSGKLRLFGPDYNRQA